MKRDVSLYEILEVSPLASALVIRAAYRCLAQFNHPDKNPGTDTAIERQSRLNRAYAVLSDPEQRRRYDQEMKKGNRRVHSVGSGLRFMAR